MSTVHILGVFVGHTVIGIYAWRSQLHTYQTAQVKGQGMFLFTKCGYVWLGHMSTGDVQRTNIGWGDSYYLTLVEFG